jgi:hypothetical protein
MVLKRKGSQPRSAAAAPSALGASNVNTTKRRKPSKLFRIFRPFIIIALSLLLAGGCLYIGFLFGEFVGQKYVEHYALEEVEPKPQVAEEEEDYKPLLKYPPPPQRRGIRSRSNP